MSANETTPAQNSESSPAKPKDKKFYIVAVKIGVFFLGVLLCLGGWLVKSNGYDISFLENPLYPIKSGQDLIKAGIAVFAVLWLGRIFAYFLWIYAFLILMRLLFTESGAMVGSYSDVLLYSVLGLICFVLGAKEWNKLLKELFKQQPTRRKRSRSPSSGASTKRRTPSAPRRRQPRQENRAYAQEKRQHAQEKRKRLQDQGPYYTDDDVD